MHPDPAFRLLLVEDSADDAELLLHALRADGLAIDARRVDTPEDLADALRAEWDAVIADDALPVSSALTTVAAVTAAAPGTPVIVVSGAMSEEAASEVLRAGARDFVTKQNLVRLAPALRRELEQATERKRRAHNRRAFQAIFDGALDAMVIADDAGWYVQANPAACELYGVSEDELLSMNVVHLGDAGIVRTTATWGSFLSEGRSEGEVEITHPDGTVRVAEYRATANILPGMHLSVLRDVTERRATDEELRKSRELYEIVVTHANDQIALLDLQGKILFVSPATERVIGPSADVVGRHFLDFVHSEDKEQVVARLAEQMESGPSSVPGPVRIRTIGGDWMLVEGSSSVVTDRKGNPSMIVTTSRDVTARERAHDLEVQLQQSQKLEAVGRLAGGVAHDFNNLLMAITGYSDLVLESLGPGQEEIRESITEIRRAADRGGDLTKQLLAYSRRQVLRREVVDLNAVVSEFTPMLARLLGEDIHLRMSLAREECAVEADRGQLGQVLVNLAVNARDAMPEGGVLALSTRHAGELVHLVVEDGGSGIDADTLQRIFEPFFTTKNVGEGTGLGLATVHGIVEQSGGTIAVASHPGTGTTFTITLPRSAEPLATPAPAAQRPLLGTERILVVEDDTMVRSIIDTALSARGYDVTVAAEPSAALELATAETFDLLLTDVVMPEMGGRELVELVAELRPDIRVVYMSGYPGDAVARRGVPLEPGSFLQKPFSLVQLAERVRDALDA